MVQDLQSSKASRVIRQERIGRGKATRKKALSQTVRVGGKLKLSRLEMQALRRGATVVVAEASGAVLEIELDDAATVKKHGPRRFKRGGGRIYKAMSPKMPIDASGGSDPEPGSSALAGQTSGLGGSADARAELAAAMSAAREKGAVRAAEILSGPEMCSTDDFAALLGVTRETVHNKRRRHEVFGLQGPKRGVRFPAWQLDPTGMPLPRLADLYTILGDEDWRIYRFLTTPYASLGGATAVEALKAGRIDEVLGRAEALARGSFD